MEKLDFKLTNDYDMEMYYPVIQGTETTVPDYSFISEELLRKQVALLRIKSIKANWFYDNIGADLEEVLGYPAVEETKGYICDKIINALTYDEYFKKEDIYIELVNEEKSEIWYKVYVKTLDETSASIINVYLDLTKDLSVWS